MQPYYYTARLPKYCTALLYSTAYYYIIPCHPLPRTLRALDRRVSRDAPLHYYNTRLLYYYTTIPDKRSPPRRALDHRVHRDAGHGARRGDDLY